MGMASDEEVLAPRLCHIQKWPDFEGFGFNLHAEKGRIGQYVGKVDDASPAEAAGLKQGDRILEVNGVNISNENHRQVVARIKAVADETRLLVVDAAAEAHFKQRELVVRGDMPGVRHLSSNAAAASDPDHAPHKHHEQLKEEVTSTASSATTPETVRKVDVDDDDVVDDNKSSGASSLVAADSPRPADKVEKQPDLPTQITQVKIQESASTNRPPGLNMTAAEMRAQLAQRKKFDPKKENMDLKRKFDIVQTL